MNINDKKIEILEKEMSKSQLKRYKIKQLKRMIQSVYRFGDAGCHDCVIYQSTLERMITNIEVRGNYREFINLFCLIRNHLIKEHHYVQAYMKLSNFTLVWSLFAALIGHYVLDNYMISLAGAGFGFTIGIIQEHKAEKNEKRL